MEMSDTPRPKTPHAVMAKIMMLAFPGGSGQAEAEIDQLHALLPKLTSEEADRLLFFVKVQQVTDPGSTEEQMLPMILKITNGKLTEEEMHDAYVSITGGEPTVTGGDGLSAETAIVIDAKNSGVGISLEYAHLDQAFGKRVMQSPNSLFVVVKTCKRMHASE